MSAAPKTKNRVKPGQWIWSVNAFHDDPASQWRAVEALRALESEGSLSIKPVSCLAIGQYDPESRTFPNRWHDLAESAHKNLEKLIKKGNAASIGEPRLLRQETPAVAAAVEALIRFAVEDGAEGIALTSHGRKGPMRLLLGSFAESLVLHSPLPVLVINPKAAKPKRLKTIVFPTDFSEPSRSAFDRTVAMAARTGAAVVLFHKLHILYPEVGNAAPVGSSELSPLSALETRLRSLGEIWVGSAKKAGVPAKLLLDLKPGRTLEALLGLVKRQGNDTIVAMASTSGPVRALLLGNLPRQVLRLCRQPVLIFHAEQESLTQRFLAQTTQLAFAFGANLPMR